jgi:hypothetical protein
LVLLLESGVRQLLYNTALVRIHGLAHHIWDGEEVDLMTRADALISFFESLEKVQITFSFFED